jgi:hypothetical protein
MQKASRSDTETVGDKSWDELWMQSAPLDYPNAADLQKEGWRSITDLTIMWKCSVNTARDTCAKMVADKRMESKAALIGETRMRGTVYRPIRDVKTAKKR